MSGSRRRMGGVACGRVPTRGDPDREPQEVLPVTHPDPHPIYTSLVAKHGDPGVVEPQEPVDRRPEPQESLRSRSERTERRA